MKQLIILIIFLFFMSGCTIVYLSDGTMVTAPGRLDNEEIYALNQKYLSDNASRSLNAQVSGPLSGWDFFSNGYMYPYDHFNDFYDPFYAGYYPYYWYQYPYLPSYYYDDYYEDIYGERDVQDAIEDLRDARRDVLQEVREGVEDWVEYRKDLRNDRIEQINDWFDHRWEYRMDRRDHFRDSMNEMSRNIRHMRELRMKRRRGFFSIR